MLSFQDFFTVCAGFWRTERTYHSILQNQIERSYTEFRVDTLDHSDKQEILSGTTPTAGLFAGIKIDQTAIAQNETVWPGFAIAFDTRSETGEQVSMRLKALFVPDAYVISSGTGAMAMPLPAAAAIDPNGEVIQGLYLRDQGYSESGAIAGRFTYHPTRQILEMVTYYSQSVAVDQMRLVSPTMRLRTIITYRHPDPTALPTEIDLVGFGVEHKQA